MKNLKSLVLGFALVVLTSNIYSQVSCSSHIYSYDGPANTNQWTSLLETSNLPAIKSLTPEFKQLLIDITVFKNGRVAGFATTDPLTLSLIDKFYANNAAAVLTAIVGDKVTIVTSDTKPTVVSISHRDFAQLAKDNGIQMGKVPTDWSWCNNCYAPGGGTGTYGTCCQVGGKGCADLVVPVGGTLYDIEPQN